MINHDNIFTRICYVIVFLLVIAALFPFLYIFLISISTGTAIASGSLFSTDNIVSLDSYISLFKYADLHSSFANSIVLSVIGTILNMAFTVSCAYALSSKETYGKRLIYGILILAMFFRGEMIPSYVWMSELGLLDSYFAIWLTKLVSVYNIFILSSFFQILPPDLLNAAKLDGAGAMNVLWKIVLPMSKPALVSIGLFYLTSWWNDYYLTMIYIRNPDKYTLPVRIIQMITNVEDSSVYVAKDAIYAKLSVYGIRAAGIVISILPMLIVIPFLQKNYINFISNNKRRERN